MDKILLKKVEFYFFLLVATINSIPIFLFRFFPTLDGPAHLYNSNIIFNLLFNNDSIFHRFYVFNTEPVPNWTGHIILSFFNFFLPAFLADKILLLFYFIGLPLVFRRLIKTISPQNYLMSYLIFPFSYSFPLYLGFYNFCLSLIFLLISINYWLIHSEKMTFEKSVILFLLISATYFSHIFTFGILMLTFGIHILSLIIFALKYEVINYKNILRVSIKKTLLLFSISLLILFLFFSYFYFRPPVSAKTTYLSFAALIDWIKNLRPKFYLSSSEEGNYTKILFYLIYSIFIIAMFNRINSKSRFVVSDFSGITALVLLFLYFILPDSVGDSSYICVRVGLLFFIFLIIWLCAQSFPKWLVIIVIGITLFCQFNSIKYFITSIRELNSIAIECNNASMFIDPNSTVIPLNCSNNLLFDHFSNYLGIDKPMVIMENYECLLDYFPLKWKKDEIQHTVEVGLKPDQLYSIIQKASIKYNYIFILGNLELKSDTGAIKLREVLSEKFNLLYHTENCKLYKSGNANMD